MSTKNSESALPQEFNENWGSNFMMDGFWHDMDYGNGLEESIEADPVPQPSSSGFSKLPDGVVMGNDCMPEFHGLPEIAERESGIDLANLEIVAAYDPTRDPSTLGVVDHEWLGEAFQDPSRLPQNPTDDGIDQLEQAWGDRTDGIRRIDMRDRIETQPNLGERKTNPVITRQLLAAMVQSAMRRSAAGRSVTALRAEAQQLLGDEGFRHVAKAFQAIEAEHGLVGNVYVRANAYPGLLRGKWGADLKKTSGRARYLVSSSADDAACAASLGMQLVAHPDEIDWSRALERYAPGLRASGRLTQRVASGSERADLRAAFLREGSSPRMFLESTKPVQTMPADTVTTEEAKRAFASNPAKVRQRVTDDRPAQQEQARLARRLGMMVQARLISQEEAEKICAAGGSARARLKMAELLAARTKQANYSGPNIRDPRVKISAEEFTKTPAKRHAALAKTAAQAEDGERRQLLEKFLRLQQIVASAQAKVVKVGREVLNGLHGKELRSRVAALFNANERKLVASALDPILVRGGYFDESTEARAYQGPVLREAVAPKLEKQASPREIAGAVRWALQQMNDGFAGESLDRLLRNRLTPSLLKAASEELSAARAQHEALAGHLYVDAASYASAEGTKGCDVGALRHRANGVKHVLAMPRCSNCVYRNVNNVCQKYNKELVAGVDANVAADFRRNMLAAHGQSDQEALASLFLAPDVLHEVANPVSEFGLHNASLDDVSTEALEYADIGNVFFGGMEL